MTAMRRWLARRRRPELFEHVRAEIDRVEQQLGDASTRTDALRGLRALPLSDFGAFLMTLPNPAFPRISRLLPRMASAEVQRSWTGTSGVDLLNETIDVVRILAHNFTRFTGASLEGRTILDFGCGYGRIARLMYYFTDEERLIGIDPWPASLEVCRQDGLGANFLQSEYLPRELPVGDLRFDLVYAYSVFTHLSERATRACLETIARYAKPEGLVAITLRPVEYWDIDRWARARGRIDEQKARHRQAGFSFHPHDWAPIDGDVPYGDTTMTVEWLRKAFPQLEVAGVDRAHSAPFQICVFLRPAKGPRPG